ncbi:MAG: ABC transporter ATP-binding protein [Planctomycetes bacterium]|nr:ABC transporter ATP-binding protein [Planctomycetota bacterium]
MAFIELRNVEHGYEKGGARVTILDGVSLDVEQGDLLVLFGPSGSGKTTLLNLLATLDRPEKGTIRVAGQDLGALSGRQRAAWRARTIGYVFQHSHLVPVLTAYENVELPLFLFGLNARERHARVALALEAVGLVDRAIHLPRQLSGGQEQRVAIARAIVHDPPLLVADEPTGNLDHESASATLELLRRLNQERGTTIVMVTHDRRAAAIGSRCLVLDKGELLAHAAEEVLP